MRAWWLALVLVVLAGVDVVAMRAALGTVADQGWRHAVAITVGRWPCAEDEPYLRGVGEYDGRTWARYRCVHIDAVGRGQ